MPSTSTSPHSATSPNLLGKFSLLPLADINLRSCDSHDFPVQKLYVIDSSPVLGEQILATISHGVGPEPPEGLTATCPGKDETLLPVVPLPESHTIISSLLTFLFPVPPVLPPTNEQTLELLSVAQKYQMTTALTRIRDCISRRKPNFIRPETALHVYSLAWKYELLEEALLAAAETLKSPMTIHGFEDELEIVPGAALAELWKYRRRVLRHLNFGFDTQDFLEAFSRMSDIMKCIIDRPNIEPWLNQYLDTLREDPTCFDLTTFHLDLSNHISSDDCGYCESISSGSIRNFWAALTTVFHESIRNAESEFSLAQSDTQSSTRAMTGAEPVLKGVNMQGADVILQSSDLISFRVHKSTLAISSPFFNDLFSLPQPPDGGVIDGLPVIDVPEDAEVLHSLFTLLYPIPSVIPDSYEKTLALLATSEKYGMDTVSSTIRSEMCPPTTKTAFHAYAIASSKRLIPEMEDAARLTLNHPMTFETIVDALPLFEGSALHDLVCFRKRCHDNLLSFFVGFVDGDDSLSKGWNNCRKTKRSHSTLQSGNGTLAGWFHNLVFRHINNLKDTYACPLPKSTSLRREYNEVLRAHISGTQCSSCSNLHATGGEALREKWLNRVTEVRNCEPFQPDTKASDSPGNSDNTEAR